MRNGGAEASQPPALAAAVDDGGHRTTLTSAIPADVLVLHILTRLDARSLASAASASRRLRRLSSQSPHLWSRLCLSTWPSLRLLCLIATYPGGPRSLFSDCSCPLPHAPAVPHRPSPPAGRLISAVDIRHGGVLLFSGVQETATATGWFRHSPFRIDMLDPKESVPTRVPHPADDGSCAALEAELTLSWIMAEPSGRRAMDVSCRRPISVRRHWLSGEVEAVFSTVAPGVRRRRAAELVEFVILVRCAGTAGGGGGGTQVWEVSLRAEDMDGAPVAGEEGAAILQRAMEGGRGRGSMEAEGRRRYEDFLQRKKQRKEKTLRAEQRMDRMCVAAVAIIFAALCFFICR